MHTCIHAYISLGTEESTCMKKLHQCWYATDQSQRAAENDFTCMYPVSNEDKTRMKNTLQSIGLWTEMSNIGGDT